MYDGCWFDTTTGKQNDETHIGCTQLVRVIRLVKTMIAKSTFMLICAQYDDWIDVGFVFNCMMMHTMQ